MGIFKRSLSTYLFASVLLMGIAAPLVLAAVAPPSFSISPSSGSYYSGCGDDFTVNMLINTNNNETDAANIIVGYDDSKMSITDEDGGQGGIQVSPGSLYDSYASYTVDEAGDRILMTGYNVGSTYNSGTNFATFGSFQFTPLAAGSASLTIDFTPSSTTDSNIAEAITSNDLLNDVENATYTFTNDTVNPSLNTYSPAMSATGVGVSNNVSFRIQDAQCGVNLDELVITVDGVDYRNSGLNQFSASGSASDYLITVNPSSDFDYEETINVSIVGEDKTGNPVSTSYSFVTEIDNTGPTFSDQSPTNSATGVATTSNVQVRVQDGQSGVQLSSVSMIVDGVTYTQSGENTFTYSGSSNNYLITVNPPVDFTRNTSINWSIQASDNEGNSSGPSAYSFSVAENSAPTFTSIPDQSVNEGSLLTFLVEASDADGDTVSLTMQDSNLPSSANYTSINSTSGIFTWTAGANDLGVYTISFTATDDGPGSPETIEEVQITVNDVVSSNTAPSIAPIANQTFYLGSQATIIVSASDAESNNISLGMSSATTSGLTFSDVSNGLATISMDTSLMGVGSHSITVTATDDSVSPASSQISFSVTVVALPESSGSCRNNEDSPGKGGGTYGHQDWLIEGSGSEASYEPEEVTEESISYVCPEVVELTCPEVETIIEYVSVETEVIKEIEVCTDEPTVIYETIAEEVIGYNESDNIRFEEILVENTEDGLVSLEAKVVGGDFVEIVWHTPTGPVSTHQRISGRHVSLHSPEYFTPGRYYLELSAKNLDTMEVSPSNTIQFEVTEENKLVNQTITDQVHTLESDSRSIFADKDSFNYLIWLISMITLFVLTHFYRRNKA